MASQQQRGPRPAPYCSKSPLEQPLQVKVVGLFKSSSFHIAKSAAETTVGPLSTFFSGEGAKCSSQLSLFPSGHTYSDPLSKVIPSGHIYSDPLSKSLKSNYPTKFEDPIIVPLQEFAWDQYLQEKKRELKNEIWEYSSCVMCFVNDQFLGDAFDLQKWAHKMWDVVDFKPPALYEALTVDYSAKFLRDTKHGFVFLDISIDFHPIGRLVLELYYDACPKTCRNFQVLCTGKAGYSQRGIKLHYMGSIFHRIVQNGWIQGGDQSFDFTQTRFLTNSTKLNFRGLLGDIVAGKGDDGESIYGPTFEDENFSIPHDKRGVLGMVNKGRHSNGSQFYITLQPTPYLDRKYVAFGQLIEGTQVLRKLELVPTENERPKQCCMIVDSGDHYA